MKLTLFWEGQTINWLQTISGGNARRETQGYIVTVLRYTNPIVRIYPASAGPIASRRINNEILIIDVFNIPLDNPY